MFAFQVPARHCKDGNSEYWERAPNRVKRTPDIHIRQMYVRARSLPLRLSIERIGIGRGPRHRASERDGESQALKLCTKIAAKCGFETTGEKYRIVLQRRIRRRRQFGVLEWRERGKGGACCAKWLCADPIPSQFQSAYRKRPPLKMVSPALRPNIYRFSTRTSSNTLRDIGCPNSTWMGGLSSTYLAALSNRHSSHKVLPSLKKRPFFTTPTPRFTSIQQVGEL